MKYMRTKRGTVYRTIDKLHNSSLSQVPILSKKLLDPLGCGTEVHNRQQHDGRSCDGVLSLPLSGNER